MVDAVNDWLFEEGRTEGDTGIVTYDGRYTGAHILYFVGRSDTTFADYQADQAMRNQAYSDWMTAAEEAAEVVRGNTKLAGRNR